jgi:RNA polymerase sigma-70 factor (ECF subfamily)
MLGSPLVGRLWAAFVDGLGGVEAPPEAEDILRERVASALAAWPEIDVEDVAIARGLGAVAADSTPVVIPEAEPARDIAIAIACANHDHAAMAAFEARYFSGVGRAVGHIVPDAAALDEVLQRLRDRLFIAPAGGTPPVSDFAGRGDLRQLVNVAAVRIALNVRRGDNRRRGREERWALDAEAMAPALRDPELDFVKQSYREQFKAAFEATIAALEPRERNLLRAHLVEHLSIDDLGHLYGVHRATAARWLAAARGAVAEGTRRRLEEALTQGDEELGTLLELIRSRLDLSITRVLAR